MSSPGRHLAVSLEIAALLTICAMTVMAVRSAVRPLRDDAVRHYRPMRVGLTAADPAAREDLIFGYRARVDPPPLPAPPPSLAETDALKIPEPPPIGPVRFRKPIDAENFTRGLLPEWNDDVLPLAPPLFVRTVPREATKSVDEGGRGCTVTKFTAGNSPVPVYVIESDGMTAAETVALENAFLTNGDVSADAVVGETVDD